MSQLLIYRGHLPPSVVEEMRDEHEGEHRWNCPGPCPACKEKTSIRGRTVQVMVRGVWIHAVMLDAGRLFPAPVGRVTVPCRGCGKPRLGRKVQGIVNAAKFCDARCMGATGDTCECSCGGANHGGGHSI